MHVAELLFGRPLATEESGEQRIGPLTGVPVLGLDALASAAYGPEAMLTVLIPLGGHALDYTSGITLAIGVLLGVVYLSYRQTIAAYPNGGGAYSVAKENFGTRASLIAAAALALDYILNVAVAIAAGVGACVSIAPVLLPYTLPLCLGLLALLTLVSLRGLRTTGAAFVLPTWAFVVCTLGVMAFGLFHVLLHGASHPHPAQATRVTQPSNWLILHAFASGCTAMTGVEAVSNAVPVFREPSVRKARRTLSLIILMLLLLLAGEATLARAYHITATPPGRPGYQSVLSQLIAAVAGRDTMYYVTLSSAVAVLCLSANTSFAAFPRLCRALAEDKFLPEAFARRGRRLALSHGILALTLLSGILLIVFGGVTDALIPLFAVGAFGAFTLSQAGMMMHWWQRRRQKHARHALALNGFGALATGITTGIILVAKFTQGAWLSLLMMALILLMFEGARRHYAFVARVTRASDTFEFGRARSPLALVPIRRWDAVAIKALRLAVNLAPDVHCVQVLTGEHAVDDLSARWHELVEQPAERQSLPRPKLAVLRSEYRALFKPLLGYVTQLEREHPDRQLVVVVPELIEKRWYHALLHNHNAALIKALLLFRGGPQIVVVSVPWYLRDWGPERRQLFSKVTCERSSRTR